VRPGHLKLHQLAEPVVTNAVSQVFLGVGKACEFVLRQIHTSHARIFAEVAEDVRELKRQAAVDRPLPSALVAKSPDVDAAQSDGAGHLVAIVRQVRKIVEGARRQIGLDAGDDVPQVFGRNLMPGDDVGERRQDATVLASSPQRLVERAAPAGQFAAAFVGVRSGSR
jgi:hypothetical protein